MNAAEFLVPPPQCEERLAALPPDLRECAAQLAASAIKDEPFFRTEAGRMQAWKIALDDADQVRRKREQPAPAPAAERTEADPDRFVRATWGGWELLQRDIPEPPSIIGRGMVCAADLCFLFGENGAGKSQLAVQLAVARALPTTWIGFDVAPGRTGLLLMELDAWAWKQRIRAAAGDKEDAALDAIRGLCRPYLRDVVALNTEADMTALRRWIEAEKLTLAVLDPLFRLHTADENDASEMGVLIQRLDALRVDTGCALLIPHHTRKGQAGGKDSPRDAARGSGVLSDAPSFYARLQKKSDDFRVLQFGKTSRTAEPPDQWLAKDPESGVLSPVDSPTRKGDATRARVLEELSKGGAAGTPSEAIARALGLARKTVVEHLRALEAEGQARKTGGSRNTLWLPPGVEPAQGVAL